MAASFLRPLTGPGTAACRLVNTRTGATVATRLEAAFDSATRRRGLLGRADLPEGTAMVIAPCPAIHTCFMQFPIDVVFVSREGRVVALRRDVRPWRIAIGLGAFAAIELRAGAIASSLQVGDLVAVHDPLPAPGNLPGTAS